MPVNIIRDIKFGKLIIFALCVLKEKHFLTNRFNKYFVSLAYKLKHLTIVQIIKANSTFGYICVIFLIRLMFLPFDF